MKWAARLGTFAGIDVYVHATFLLLILYFGLIFWAETGTLAGVLGGILLILTLFVCVLLHEFGHALTARRYGIRTKHITLLPIGGLAMLESMPKEPRQEVIVALAGPAVNIAIAAVLFLLIQVAGRPGAIFDFDIIQGGFLANVLAANLILAIFNMIPAFPMDGGRVLRALLSMRMDRVRATRVAAAIGQSVAIGFGFLGLMGNPILVLIAVFIWIGAAAEASATEVDARLRNQPVRRAMITDFRTLSPDQPLADAVDLTLAGTQRDFPVVSGQEIVGVLTQAAILRGLRDRGTDGLVREVMQPPTVADIHDTLSHLLENLQSSETQLVCITRQDRLVGLVDLENIGEFLRIQQALADH